MWQICKEITGCIREVKDCQVEGTPEEVSDKFNEHFNNIASKNLRALEQLNQPTCHWSTLIVFLIQTKLDSVTVREWEKFRADKDVPTWDDLKKFLKSRADFLETIETNHTQKHIEKKYQKHNTTKGFYTSGAESKPKCVFCANNHYSQTCENFLKLSVNKRKERIKELKLCMNCLRPGHFSEQCRSSNCKKCNGRHHTQIHSDIVNEKTPDVNTNNSSSTNSNKALSYALSANKSNSCVLLYTAIAHVVDNESNRQNIRILLDSGSESSFIRADVCKRLKLRTTPVNVEVCGLNRAVSYIKSKCSVDIHARINSFSTNIHCYILPEITGKIPD
ncbi:uncharacterized protein LOC123672361 [Harmonia axyridis]|uniref:uncharacterized protein LOC123672361 n=1 Tax=Harmonia axyridis TaxID=115357 RepID=UPI001E2764EC|nr:uncharacterized protein LOC123672361 [Harmonia axyridis]